MTKFEREFHAHQAHKLLTLNDVKLSTKMGKMMVYSYYMGVIAAAEPPPAYVTLCLYSGRYEDLIRAEPPEVDAP